MPFGRSCPFLFSTAYPSIRIVTTAGIGVSCCTQVLAAAYCLISVPQARKREKSFRKIYNLAEYGISVGDLLIVDVSIHFSRDNLGGNYA